MVASSPLASRQSARNNSGFRPDIQGMRGIAVLLVVIYHAAPAIIPGGYIGVDVFFVISGFLVTSHLLGRLQNEGGIPLGAFYAGRALRILPAAFTVLVLTLFAALIWMPPMQYENVVQWATATALYAPNMWAGLRETDYLAETAPSVFQHYWSLGIEEQFYLIWPAILVLGWRIFGRSEKALLAVTVALVVSSFLLCLAIMQVSQPWAFFSLPTRAWELGMGALVALQMRRLRTPLKQRPSKVLAWGGLVALCIAALTFDTETTYPGHFTLIPVLATALMILGGDTGPVRVLSARPLQFIGLISYSLYLVHWPMLVLPQATLGYARPLPPWIALGLGVLAVPLAYVLYRFVEDPVRKSGTLHRMKSTRILIGVVALTTLATLVALGTNTVSQSLTLDAGRAVAAGPLAQLPASTDFVPSNLIPSLRDSPADTALIYRNGCHRAFNIVDPAGCQFGSHPNAPVVVLFGDSHAGSWFPALHELAEEGLINLNSNVKSGCASAEITTSIYSAFNADCDQWRTEVIRRLNVEQPDVVLLANYADGNVHRDENDFLDQWSQGMANTIKGLPRAARVGVIADVPDMGESPAICLSAHLYDTSACVRRRSDALDSESSQVEKTVADTAGAAYLDLTDHMCGPSSCPPIIGNLLTHRDAHHLSATFSEALTPALWRELQPLLE